MALSTLGIPALNASLNAAWARRAGMIYRLHRSARVVNHCASESLCFCQINDQDTP